MTDHPGVTPHVSEHARLEEVATWYSSHAGFDAQLVQYGVQRLDPWLRGRRCLELGSADGAMTAHLLARFDEVVAVDGSATLHAELERRFAGRPGFSAVCALFEEFVPEQPANVIVAAHVLEHVEDPIGVMRVARAWLAPGGHFVIVVPNATSLHRLAGVKMGLLTSPEALGENDVALGHRRMYTADTLAADIAAAGWRIERSGGTFVKPLTNGQCEQLPVGQRDALFALGEDLPELCSEVWAVCTPETS